MRKLLLGAILITVAGCGGGGSSSSSPTQPSGTIGGQAFEPAGVSAITVEGDCPAAGPLPAFKAKALAVRFGSFADVCTDLAGDPICKLTTSSQSVTVVFADVALTPAVVPALGTGTFTVNADPAVPELQTTGPLAGTAVSAFATGVTTTAACPVDTKATVAQGTLTITEVSATEVKGSVYLTFGTLDGETFTANGDTLKGDFTASMCGASSVNVCALSMSGGQCATAPTCD